MTRTRRIEWDFTFETSGRDVLDEEVFDALTEAGCDDALIGRVGGVDRLNFIREAGSYCEAVRSAMEDVQSVPGVRVTRVINENAAVGVAFAEAVNAVLVSPQQCPDVPGGEEQAELRRIREIFGGAPSRSGLG